MAEEIENGEAMRNPQVKRRIAVASTTLALALSGAAWAGCGDDESSTSATDATDAAKSDATDATNEAKEAATDATNSVETDATDAIESDATDAANDVKEDAGG